MNRPEFIPEIKEKFRAEKIYILTEGHNYKLMNLLCLHIDMYYHSYYENDMHMGNLYVKLRIADYKGENIENIEKIKKEILDGYDKLYNEYVIDEILPPIHSDFFWIFQHYIEHNGVESLKNISLIIDWDRDTYPKSVNIYIYIYIYIHHHFIYYYIYIIRNFP
jgi:hypothetical protein